jgi:transcriptional antiterminator RfaH
MAFWTAARIRPRKERLALHCLNVSGFETYVPRTKDRIVRRGRKVSAIAPLFPSYVFILIELQWYGARFALGIANLIMDGERPAKVPDAVIADLRARERDGLVRLPPPPKAIAAFAAGDELRVRSGPFTGLYGLYAGMAPRERIFVLLRMLGGERTVELAHGDVRKIGTGIGTGRAGNGRF